MSKLSDSPSDEKVDIRLENFLNNIEDVKVNYSLVPDEAKERYSQLVKPLINDPQAKINSKSLMKLLREFLTYHDQEYTQSIVNAGGQELIKAMILEQKYQSIKKVLLTNQISYLAKYSTKTHAFIIKSQTSGCEYRDKYYEKVKEESKTTINHDNRICDSKTNEVIENLQNVKYVVSKKGTLYVSRDENNPYKHTCFLKGKPGDELYGFGKAVACGGFLSIKDGKIIAIDNHSGHYRPIFEQLKVILNYFKQQGILAENIIINEYGMDINPDTPLYIPHSLNELNLSSLGEILDMYTEVNGEFMTL